MQFVYIFVLGLHVLAGVFWAGTTIAVARDPEIRIERFFQPQMNAAGMVFLTGALLWYSSTAALSVRWKWFWPWVSRRP
ncbi:hypothetical protein [Mesorhizobium sp.]|uniref:hypothetical protein n=1 Tax=Mesorhizobium sp. TaxID=1871066 RepID=UPI0025798095|nr:hypothetical protein [Mesorhizobium sp.]